MIFDPNAERELIEKGWSEDRKYKMTCANGEIYLLRIMPEHRTNKGLNAHLNMQKAASLDIPMSISLEFGRTDEGPYLIQTWIDGLDAEDCMMTMDHESQYRYGLEAGRILARIHTLPAPDDVPSWESRFQAKIDRKIKMYENCSLKYDGGELFLDYIRKYRHLLSGRPQCYQHGDYHIGNMMIDQTGRLVIIDFEKDDFGDPWEEFNRIVWCAQTAPRFAAGMVDGYFQGNVPDEFWGLLALYICSNTIGSLPWAIKYGEDEVRTMTNQAAQVLQWYDDMHKIIPLWYEETKNG